MSAATKPVRILVVDDDEQVRDYLGRLFRREGYQPLEAEDGVIALAMIREEAPDVALLDVRLPGLSGIDILREAKKCASDLAVVMMTGHGTAKDVVTALRAGACDYLLKPFEPGDVLAAVRSALAERVARNAPPLPPCGLHDASGYLHEMMGPSEAISSICADIARVADSDFTVLITGETGSGKELIARAIHSSSVRAKHAFVAVDCGAIPENLIESDLFGHEKGAFTGADRSVPGKFEAARGGTLFLDEIPNMSLGSQAKLLRALQERAIMRVGGLKLIDVDTRVLVAANEDLEQAIARRTFRRDLFFRLNEFVIRVPALRHRREDIPFLARRFLDLTSRELKKKVRAFSPRAVDALASFDWPGNCRQLRSTIRRAVLMADDVVDISHLNLPKVSSPTLPTPAAAGRTTESLRDQVRHSTEVIERAAILHALTAEGWNKTKAARLLQIDYKTLHTKIREYGFQKPKVTADVKKENQR
jgi:DNA-binding NtrC family response regulator